MRHCLAKWRRRRTFLTFLCVSGLYMYFLTYQSISSLFSNKEVKGSVIHYVPAHINKTVKVLLETADRAILEDIDRRIAEPIDGLDLQTAQQNGTVFDSSRGQFSVVDKYFSEKKNGYFLEVGTDGISGQSLTFLLEKARGWTGLVIEPYITQYQALRTMRRSSKFLQACIKNGTSSWPFDGVPNTPCYEVKHIVQALRRDRIDLLVLNLHGGEHFILETFPFKQIEVYMITIEIVSVSVDYGPFVLQLRTKGYRCVQVMTNHIFKKTDLIFVKEENVH